MNNLSKIFKSSAILYKDTESIEKTIKDVASLQEKLRSINTDGVEPMFYCIDNDNFISNKDVSEGCHTLDKIMDNAPKTEDGFFVVPKVVKK